MEKSIEDRIMMAFFKAIDDIDMIIKSNAKNVKKIEEISKISMRAKNSFIDLLREKIK